MLRYVPLALLLALAHAPLAAADEDAADCEAGQPWLLPQRQGVQPVFDAAEQAVGADAAVCEGEQWDGADQVSDQPTSCAGTVEPDEVVLVGLCLGQDPNAMSGENLQGPAGVRLSTDASNEAYAAANLALASRVAVYAGTCGAGEEGLEGEAQCRGTREARVGIYWRDNTPGNVVTELSPRCLLSITGCGTSESDCSYDLYRKEQESGMRMCGRDNTALGVGLVLP